MGLRETAEKYKAKAIEKTLKKYDAEGSDGKVGNKLKELVETKYGSDYLGGRESVLGDQPYTTRNNIYKYTYQGYDAAAMTFAGAHVDHSKRFTNHRDIDVVDSDWVLSRFMTPSYELHAMDAINRYMSASRYKFSSTQIGGHMAVNPRPQFTRYADIKMNKRPVPDNKVTLYEPTSNPKSFSTYGMGRYYSESLDDHAQNIYMQFGVPEFQSLLGYFLGAVDYIDVHVAQYGTYPVGYSIGNAIGTVARWLAFPMVSLLVFIGKGIGAILGIGKTHDYYQLKPDMTNYWGTVNTILNDMAAELGILNPEIFGLPERDGNRSIGAVQRASNYELELLNRYFPDIFEKPKDNVTGVGYIDVYRIVTRYQRAAIAMTNFMREKTEKQAIQSLKVGDPGSMGEDTYTHSNDKFYGRLLAAGSDHSDLVSSDVGWLKGSLEWIDKNFQTPIISKVLNEHADRGFSWMIDKLTPLTGKEGKPSATDDPERSKRMKEYSDATAYKSEDDEKKRTNPLTERTPYDYKEEMEKLSAFDAVSRDGGMYAVFQVDFTGSYSDSGSSSTSPVQTGGMIKGVSSAARDVQFSLADGNLVDGMGTIKRELQGLAMGAVDGVTFGLGGMVAALLGGAYVDMPDKWDDSNFDVGTQSFTMSLRAPYGNVYSQLQNIYLPLAMILAGSLPRLVGKNAYASPFLCSMFCKGMDNIRLGMITSVSITRGGGNLPYSRDRKALDFDVSFTVKNFSNLVAAPVNASVFSGWFNAFTNDSSNFNRYLATICSRDLMTDRFFRSNLKVRLTKAMSRVNMATDLTRWSFAVGEFMNPVLSGVLMDFSLANNYEINSSTLRK